VDTAISNCHFVVRRAASRLTARGRTGSREGTGERWNGHGRDGWAPEFPPNPETPEGRATPFCVQPFVGAGFPIWVIHKEITDGGSIWMQFHSSELLSRLTLRMRLIALGNQGPLPLVRASPC
jgi:hypothetical protein